MIAALVHGPVMRLVMIGIVLMALQNTIFVDMQPAGVVIQVVLAFAAAAGAAGGPERGAIAGFVMGLIYDLGTGAPLGASAITMGAAGVVAGGIALIRIEPHWWLAAIFVALGSAVGEFGVPVVRAFIGQTNVLSAHLAVVVPVVAVAAAVMSPVLVPMGRWALRIERTEWKAPPE